MKFESYIGLGVLIDQKRQKCWIILRFELDLLENNIFEFFCQSVLIDIFLKVS